MSDQKILDALARMDHADDSQWLDDGRPRVAVVQKLADDQSIGMAAIRNAAPDFRRSVVDADPLAEPETESDDTPAVSAEAPDATAVAADDASDFSASAPRDSDDAVTETAEAASAVPPVSVLSVNEANAQLAMAQARFRQSLEKQRKARGVVATAIAAWQKAVGGTPSHTELVREHLKGEAMRREARARGELPQITSKPGPSYLDRARFWAPRGDGNDFARRQMRVGASRGAYPASQRGRQLPKVQSEA